jgi:DNA-binding CsgD family transcriptional regulator/pimeloyl-ACP methyl ester carboxylesterase
LAEGVRFCSSRDGTQIGYSTFGNGRPLVIVPAWWMSPETDRRRLIGKDFWSDLPPGHRSITYDLRGIGVSSREVDDVSAERQFEDLAALADHLQLQEFDVLCFHEGLVPATLFATRFPGRIRRMVLYNPCAHVPGFVGRQHIAVWNAIINVDWGMASRCFAQLLYPKGPIEAQEASTKAIRDTQSPAVASLYLEHCNSFDIRKELSELKLPVLVISREGPGKTPLFPEETVQDVARRIPGVSYQAYETAPATCPYFDYRAYRAAVREFFADAPPELPPHPTLSAREVEVLRLVAIGKTNAEIARELVLSKTTVDRHVSNILGKTGASNRAEAVLYAARHGLVG